jgi:YbgC/YbaW family acyl-CoA thioester hydrolase
MKTYHTQRRVEFCDTDMAGIVHFSCFFRYMESAEHQFLRALGLSVVLNWDGEQLAFPRVSATCDYLQPARFEDVLDVEVGLERVGGKSLTYGFTFRRQDQPIARGRIVCVCCRMDARTHQLESVDLPDTLKARLQAHDPS